MILFEQAQPPAGKDLNVPTHKEEIFVFDMHRAFGGFPVVLGKDQLERLEGMAATWHEQFANPYDELVRAVKRYGAIKVWAKHETTD